MPNSPHALTPAQIDQFIADGFVRIDNAFPRQLADEARAFLWQQTGCDPDDPATWTRPVIRLGGYGGPIFDAVCNTPLLHGAFDSLVGPGRWEPRHGLGTFPIRFPSEQDPGDAGWHIDVSFKLPEDDPNDIFTSRANIVSRDRALLMLFLFSDVGEDDAPTRISIGSHWDTARKLEPAGERGMTMHQMAADGFAASASRPRTIATGPAGTVYLCHPFLVHAADKNRGQRVKFMAQPPLAPAEPLSLDRPDGDYSPVEIAIRRALGHD
ncbi:phytanoyl-CoA dioxygenase [uncultured Devosia sp.]|uniref:phytanoyl-CoA dioxygenase n=1 Tax=uncultured Devosia sp. TaxID=211434 RepID=UPI0035C9BEE7